MFARRKWIKVNELSGNQCFINKNIGFKTPMLRSDLRDFSDAYIVVKGRIAIEGDNTITRRNKKLTFKTKILFWLDHAYQKFIISLQTMQKILILLNSCENYSMKTKCLWNSIETKLIILLIKLLLILG